MLKLILNGLFLLSNTIYGQVQFPHVTPTPDTTLAAPVSATLSGTTTTSETSTTDFGSPGGAGDLLSTESIETDLSTTEDSYDDDVSSSTQDSDDDEDDDSDDDESDSNLSTESADSGSDDDSSDGSDDTLDTDDSDDDDSDDDEDDSDDVSTEDPESVDDDDSEDDVSDDQDTDESVGDDDGDDVSEEDDQDSDDDDTDSDDDTEPEVDTVDDTSTDTDTDIDSETDDDDVDFCAGLEADECSSQFDDDGQQVCGININTDECYEVVESRGIYGRGNFDEGYTSAQQDAEKAKSSLNLIVGVMGAVIGLLVLCIAGGAYFVYHQGHGKIVDMGDEEEYEMEMQDLEEDIAGQPIDTADSAALIANPVSPRSPRNVTAAF